MQIPPTIPKPAAPGPQELKPEPVARIAPVVMNDAGARIDPSVILKTPVPVSQSPRVANNVRPTTDQSGTIYTSPEIGPDTEAAAHIATLMSQLGKAESGTHVLRWPLPREVAQQQQQSQSGSQSGAGGLASNPKEALSLLKQGLDQSPMLAIANFANALGLTQAKDKANKPPAASLQSVPARGSQEVQDGLNLLMHGQLMWEGQLTQGVQAKIYREDTYGEDPKNPGGPLMKGTQISIEAELPTVGMVRIRGMQIADSVSVVVSPEQQAQAVLSQNFQELKDQLVSSQLESVKIRLQNSSGELLA
ncbi:MAG: hypothetical protein ACKOCR_06535 [Burkholderiaceae bacterium]